MSYTKRALDEILNCNICDGAGVLNLWVSDNDLFSFEYCECNPHQLIVEDMEVIS
jgi:hypothetical protein